MTIPEDVSKLFTDLNEEVSTAVDKFGGRATASLICDTLEEEFKDKNEIGALRTAFVYGLLIGLKTTEASRKDSE